MSGKSFEVRVLSAYCKGCGLCVGLCEAGKLYLEQTPNERGVQAAAVNAEADCTGCLRCATICPDAAIEVYVLRWPVAEAASR